MFQRIPALSLTDVLQTVRKNRNMLNDRSTTQAQSKTQDMIAFRIILPDLTNLVLTCDLDVEGLPLNRSLIFDACIMTVGLSCESPLQAVQAILPSRKELLHVLERHETY